MNVNQQEAGGVCHRDQIKLVTELFFFKPYEEN